MTTFSDLSESKIFKNEDVLSPEYLPELLPHREQEIRQLAGNITPASEGRKPQNTFFYGPPGTGKTASIKFIFRKFEEEFLGVKTIYINCWDFKTSHAVLSKIILDLGFFVHRRGWGKDEIISRLTEALNKIGKGVVVCLDEIDQLIFRDQEALYDLLRIGQYVKNPVGLVLISNDPHVFAGLEPRVRSSLNVAEIEFRAYSLEEMRDILLDRVKHGFHAGVVDSTVVLLCANHAVQKGGDVRVGLECLLRAGRLAEQEGSGRVRAEHAKNILINVKKVKPKIIEERVSEVERDILKVLGKTELMSGELYRAYSKAVKNPVAERSFRNYVNHLAEVNLIKIKKSGKKIRGSTRLISKASSA